MKKHYKSFICSFFAVMLLASNVNALTSNTETTTKSANVCKGVSTTVKETPTVEEQVKAALADPNLSKEQKANALKKLNKINSVAATKSTLSANTYSTLSSVNTLAVTYFQQENSYYCGPATVKQTLYYLAGINRSQSTIASAIGTTTAGSSTSAMVNYLNKNQSKNFYLTKTKSLMTEISMFSDAQDAMTNFKAPPFLATAFSKGGVWAYPTGGHFMNISGTDNSGSRSYQLTDPNIGRVIKGSSGKYWVPSSTLFAALKVNFSF